MVSKNQFSKKKFVIGWHSFFKNSPPMIVYYDQVQPNRVQLQQKFKNRNKHFFSKWVIRRFEILHQKTSLLEPNIQIFHAILDIDIKVIAVKSEKVPFRSFSNTRNRFESFDYFSCPLFQQQQQQQQKIIEFLALSKVP